jgi:ribosomal protein L32
VQKKNHTQHHATKLIVNFAYILNYNSTNRNIEMSSTLLELYSRRQHEFFKCELGMKWRGYDGCLLTTTNGKWRSDKYYWTCGARTEEDILAIKAKVRKVFPTPAMVGAGIKEATYERQKQRQAEKIACNICGKIVSRGNLGTHKKKACTESYTRVLERREERKEDYKIYIAEMISCNECGSMVRRGNMTKHKDTTKHKDIVMWCEELPPPPAEWLLVVKKKKFRVNHKLE